MARKTRQLAVLVIATTVILSIGALGSAPSHTADVSHEDGASDVSNAAVQTTSGLVLCETGIDDSTVRVLTSPRAVDLLEGPQTSFDWRCQNLVSALEVEETTTVPEEEMSHPNSFNWGAASAAAPSNRDIGQSEEAALVVCQRSIEDTTVRALTSPQAVSLLEGGNTGWSCTAMVSDDVGAFEETTTEEGE